MKGLASGYWIRPKVVEYYNEEGEKLEVEIRYLHREHPDNSKVACFTADALDQEIIDVSEYDYESRFGADEGVRQGSLDALAAIFTYHHPKKEVKV